jgi:Tol biopolymer transport system component
MSSRTRALFRALLLAGAAAALPASGCEEDVGDGDSFGIHTVRASVTASGGQVLAQSENVSLSGDGRFVAFDSDAPDLAPGDSNGVRDVMVKDRATGAVEIVSVNTTFPIFPPFFPSRNPRISPDGRWVVFESQETLAPGPGGDGQWRIFLHDRQNRVTQYLLGRFTGLDDDMTEPRISDDGSVVTFVTQATNIQIPGQPPGTFYTVPSPAIAAPQIWSVLVQPPGSTLVDVILVSRSTGSSAVSSNNACTSPEISASGNAIVFQSSATNLNANDPTGDSDIYRGTPAGAPCDLVTLVSASPVVKTNGLCTFPAVSGDGNLVAFASRAANINPGGTTVQQIMLKDMTAGTFAAVSLTSTGAPADAGCTAPHLTPDGRFVAFNTIAPNLAGPGAATIDQIVVRDMLGGIQVASVSSSGATADSFCLRAKLSADGRWVGWYTAASNLVAGDTNGGNDLYLRGPLR